MIRKRFRVGFVVGALGMAALANGCFVKTDDFSGTCKNSSQCPQLGGYLCASTGVWPQSPCDADAGEQGCQCEVKFPPDPYDAGSTGGGTGGGGGGDGGTGGGGGGGGVIDAGPPPDYCTEIRPVIAAKCLYTCHSAQMGFPNSPTTFRLDYYQYDGGILADGGPSSLPGLREKADRCYARMVDGPNGGATMPPDLTVMPALSAMEKATFCKWVDAGAPYGSGNCEQGGGGTDAGADAGMDAGPPISFANDIQPIFNATCNVTCHNAGNLTGTLNLTTGNSFNMLVGPNTSATCAGGAAKRVVPFAPQTSMLWQKLTPDGGYCNASMPRMMTILRTSQPANFAKIEAWIVQGAKNN